MCSQGVNRIQACNISTRYRRSIRMKCMIQKSISTSTQRRAWLCLKFPQPFAVQLALDSCVLVGGARRVQGRWTCWPTQRSEVFRHLLNSLPEVHVRLKSSEHNHRQMMRVCNCISHLTWINTRFHGDEFGSSCTEETYDFTEDFLYVTTSTLAFIIIVIFSYFGCRGLHQYEQMIAPLKLLFYCASTSSICFTILSIITICLCLSSHKKEALIVGSISTFVYAFLFLCIWANLVLRLFVAFRGSTYRMPVFYQKGYSVIFVYLVLNAFATSVCQLLMLVGMGLTPSIWFQFGLGIAFMVVFALSAMVAVCTFMSNVFVLGKSRTTKQIKPFCEEEAIGLNTMQQKLMDLSSKYVSLFMIASISSAVTLFSGFYESASDLRISLFLVPIDCCVNLICIYLQYVFAEKHYRKYCGKLDWSCKRMMTAGWVKSIHSMRRDECNLNLEVNAMKKMDKTAVDALEKPTSARQRVPKLRTIPERLSMEIKEKVKWNKAEEPAGQDKSKKGKMIDSFQQ